MIVLKAVQEVSQIRDRLKQDQTSLGFVPTMGALHHGHLSLVQKAKDENASVAVSIFVNPIQFNNPSDLNKYPRTLDADLALLEEILDQDDIVFVPSVQEMYPDKKLKKFDFGKLELLMEGEHRPGHFNGVGVVVDRLFSIIQPTKAYFGEKDYQQLAIINKLVEIESHKTKIIPCEIVREADGLAMSSRNMRLTKENRHNAGQIYNCMKIAKQDLMKGAEIEHIQNRIISELNQIPNFETEYVVFADEESLLPVSVASNKPFRCFIAIFAGEVRLIDNLCMY